MYKKQNFLSSAFYHMVGITGFDRRSRSEDTIEIKIYYYPRNLPLCENLLCLK